MAPSLGGCLKAPEPEPIPPKVEEPKGYIFIPGDAIPPGTPLNNPEDATMPAYFRLARIVSGNLVYLTPMSKAGSPVGGPFIVHLSGIVAPAPGALGWESSVKTLSSWAAGAELSASQDSKFPYDFDERPLVNIVFKGRSGDNKGKDMSLNRMMVRSGYALVDLYSTTSMDVKDWLKDEAHAKEHKFGLWKMPNIFQQLQQRSPLEKKGKPAAGAPAPAAPAASPTPAPAP